MPRFGVPEESLRPAWAGLLAEAFGLSGADVAGIAAKLGYDHCRALSVDDQVMAGLLVLPIRLSVGGALVPNAAIGLVGVAIDQRRRGYASQLMAALLAESRDNGQYVSTLYASNQPLYRAAGYEQAGSAFRASVSVPAIGLGNHELRARRLNAEDEPVIEAIHAASAVETPGFFERHPYQWERIRRPRVGPPALGLGIEEGGRLRGWLYVRHVPLGNGPMGTLEVLDVYAQTRLVALNLWATLADMGTMARTVVFNTAPNDPFYQVLPHPFVEMTLFENWMLRVTDIRALEQRGYPSTARGVIDLDVEDPLRLCHGRYRLTVEGGRGRVQPGGNGDCRLHVRGLASLFTGFASARQVELAGLGEGAESLAELCAGPLPWTRDRY